MKWYSIIVIVFFSATAKSQDRTSEKTQDRTIQKFADYPGGIDKMYEYIRRNLQYPEDALRDSITGDVFIEFVVNAEGKVVGETVKVIRSLSRSCDAEAIRLIKSCPAWIPARSRNGTEEQHISFPISFRFP